MAVKTITIDLEAYELLSRWKKPGQSFSQVVKARFAQAGSVQALREAVRGIDLSDETLQAVEAGIKRRQKDQPRRWTW